MKLFNPLATSRRLINPLNNFIIYLENLPIPLVNYVLTFACILILRNFLEGFSHNSTMHLFFVSYPTNFLLDEFLHFSLFYTIIACLLTLTFYYLTKEKISNILKVLVPAFILILSVPSLDLILSGGKGQHIAYLFPNNEHSLLKYYFTFFGRIATISFGLRLEVMIAMFWSFCYIWCKRKNIFIAIIGAILAYSVIFFISSTPYTIIYISQILHLNFSGISATDINGGLAINYFLFLLFPLGILFSFLANRKIFIAIIRDMRWLRLLHFELMLLLGIALTVQYFTVLMLINIFFLGISVSLFWLFAVITNNIPDQAIDRISNPQRPLISKDITLKQYKNIAWAVLFCSLGYAIAVNVKSFLLIGIIIVLSLLYSVPPFRLKRIPILAKAFISMISLTIILLGYVNVQSNWQDFPTSIIWIFLIGYTLTLNFIDIKDYAGDKANQIITMPILLTPKVAKFIIGIFFILTSLSFYFYLQKIFLLPILLLAGLLEFYFINKKNYQENKVLITYLLTVTMLITYIFASKLCS